MSMHPIATDLYPSRMVLVWKDGTSQSFPLPRVLTRQAVRNALQAVATKDVLATVVIAYDGSAIAADKQQLDYWMLVSERQGTVVSMSVNAGMN